MFEGEDGEHRALGSASRPERSASFVEGGDPLAERFAFLAMGSPPLLASFAIHACKTEVRATERAFDVVEFAIDAESFATQRVETSFLAPEFAIRAMMFAMPTSIHHLVYLARRALSVGSQGDFGEMMGVSRRTGQRWETGRADPSWDTICEMAKRVHPHDADLAAQLAAAAGTNLVALGVVAPAPPPQPAPPPGPPPPAAEDLVDAIVCAAAEAINVPPRDVRPALLAAFARARRLGIAIATVETALGAAK